MIPEMGLFPFVLWRGFMIVIRFIQKRRFDKLYKDLEVRVKEENKTDASWLMGFMQGLGNRVLTGYQFAALVDLLLVQPEISKDSKGDLESLGISLKQEKQEQSSVSSSASVGRINLRP